MERFVGRVVRHSFPLLLFWVWVILYLATGGLRVEVVEVLFPPAEPTESEKLEIFVLFQNASPGDVFICRWTPPSPNEPLSKTLRVDSTDGELVYKLTGFEVPTGYHGVVITDDTDFPLTTEDFYIPPRPCQYVTKLRWEDSGLLATVQYRHGEPGALLKGNWSFDGQTIPEAEAEVTLVASSGSVDFYLGNPPEGYLSGGCYEFSLLAEDVFISRTVAPPQLSLR